MNYASYFRKAGGCLQRMCNLSGTWDTWVVRIRITVRVRIKVRVRLRVKAKFRVRIR